MANRYADPSKYTTKSSASGTELVQVNDGSTDKLLTTAMIAALAAGRSFVGASAKNTGAVAVSSTSIMVPMPTEDYDTSSIYNPSTNVFTIPAGMAGKWRVTYSCNYFGTGVLYLFLRKNGVGSDTYNIVGSSAGGDGVRYAYKSLIFTFAAGDTVTLTCYAASGGTIGSSSDPGQATIMQIEYIG